MSFSYLQNQNPHTLSWDLSESAQCPWTKCHCFKCCISHSYQLANQSILWNKISSSLIWLLSYLRNAMISTERRLQQRSFSSNPAAYLSPLPLQLLSKRSLFLSPIARLSPHSCHLPLGCQYVPQPAVSMVFQRTWSITSFSVTLCRNQVLAGRMMHRKRSLWTGSASLMWEPPGTP